MFPWRLLGEGVCSQPYTWWLWADATAGEARLCSTAFPLGTAVFARSADTTAAWLVFLSRRGDGWCQPVPSAHFSLETLGPFGSQPCLNQYFGFKRHFYSFTT